MTGVIDEDQRLQAVTDMGAKLGVANRKQWRLVAPEANRKDLPQAPDPRQVKFAATIRQADRYARQWRVGRLATAAAIIAAATTTGLDRAARKLPRCTDSRLPRKNLAGVSGSLLNTNLQVAQLLAVEAYHLNQNSQTLAALFQAVTYSPSLIRYLQAGSVQSAIYGSANGKSIVAGTNHGQVVRWNVTGGPGVTVATLGGAITAVASNADGSVIAAATASEVVVWTPAQGARQIVLPQAGGIDAIAVSPTGRYIALAANGVTLFDRKTNVARRAGASSPPYAVAMPSDTRLVLANGGGPWQILSLPGLAMFRANKAINRRSPDRSGAFHQRPIRGFLQRRPDYPGMEHR